MNHPMLALSVQLLVYAAAWLVLGLGYHLNRRVALSWSLAWFCLASGALALYLTPGDQQAATFFLVNSLIVFGFALLQHGVAVFTGVAGLDRRQMAGYVAGILLLEVFRLLAPQWTVLRVALFTVLACWPLATAARHILVWLRLGGRTSTLVRWITVSPLVFAIVIFVARWVMVALGTPVNALRFNLPSDVDYWASMSFLLLLGGFNFSLAALVMGRLILKLRTLSDTDQLTGLYNRRVMMRHMDKEYARFQRSGERFSMLMLDIDHFKRINDTHGHGVGDQVLVGLAKILTSCTRQADTLARTGGEEFMLLMPMTDPSGSLHQAQRLCNAVAAAKLPTDAGALTITISVGVASVVPGEPTDDRLISRADAALYRAKEGGRNRVEVDANEVSQSPQAAAR